MATCGRAVWKAVTGCQRQLLSVNSPTLANISPAACKNLPVRTFAVPGRWMRKKEDKAPEKKVQQREKKVIDDTNRHKPYGMTAWAPVDDVYVLYHYPRTIYGAVDAIELLKKYQQLEFTPRDQSVYVDLRLDMKLEKKRKVDPFVGMVHLPFPFKTEMNKILVFTEDPNEAEMAKQKGAAYAGGAELVDEILDDKISADFYIAVPGILPKLVLLKNKLRKKFPKSSRGSVGPNIIPMLDSFKWSYEYLVEENCYVRTQIATLDMPTEQIHSNLQTILRAVRSHRPTELGPFIERYIMWSRHSEAIWFKTEEVPSEPAEENQN